MPRKIQHDPQKSRDAVPSTRSEYEAWAKEREKGRRVVLRQALLTGAVVSPLTLSIGALLFVLIKGIAFPARWPLLVSLYGVAAVIGGAFFGLFLDGTLWKIGEDRFNATNPSDLDDENLIDKLNEQRLVAWTLLPAAVGMVLIAVLPERFVPVFWVGTGITMIMFGFVCLRSRHSLYDVRCGERKSIGTAESLLIVVGGFVSVSAGIYGLRFCLPMFGD